MEMQQRLEKLEKERWAYLGLASLAVIAGLLGALLGAGIFGSGGDTVRASKLILRGAGESLVLMEPGGRPRAVLGLNDAGLPSMQFFDAKNKRRQLIGLTAHSNPQIQYFDDEGKLIAELLVNEQGLPMLTFLDASATRREAVGLELGGDPVLEFFDRNEQSQMKLTGTFDSISGASAKMQIFGLKGQPVYTVPPPPAAAPKPAPGNQKK
jgi:hypothetical protein